VIYRHLSGPDCRALARMYKNALVAKQKAQVIDHIVAVCLNGENPARPVEGPDWIGAYLEVKDGP